MKLILIGIAPWLFIIGVQLGKYSERENLTELRARIDAAWLQDCDLNKERRK